MRLGGAAVESQWADQRIGAGLVADRRKASRTVIRDVVPIGNDGSGAKDSGIKVRISRQN